MDICLSTVMLILFCLPMLLIAAMVRLSSPGPALFKQQRVGRGGRRFTLLKFRSMKPADSGPQVTAEGDARITPIGKLLRRTKLDELPQLLNVLRGEMSLVGPRPEVERYVQHYTPEQKRLLEVRPGITGAAQIAYRDEEALLSTAHNVEELYVQEILPAKAALDLAYLAQRTVLTDTAVLLKTIAALLR
jgi:lipopolysaccharide/colanic/teichoic acid biosynthesis glycosyltransferase